MAAEKFVLVTVPSNEMIGTQQLPSYEAACAEMLSQLGEAYLADGGAPAVWEVLKGGAVHEGERLGFWTDDPEIANACYKRRDGENCRWVIERVAFD